MILVQIALRNIASHKLKSFIVGGLLVFGTVLLVVGQALLGTIHQTMAQSIIGSISGHLQVSSAKGKDPLALFGGMGADDIGQIENFPKIRQVLEALPEVQAVVPMGLNDALIYGGNIIDVKLEALRDAHKRGDKQRTAEIKAHVRRIVDLLQKDMQRIGDVTSADKMSSETKQALDDLAHASNPAFWDGFDNDPLAAMEYLENKIAPLALNADLIFFRYLGTDTNRFAQNFDRFEIVDGQPIPPGHRGFLYSKFLYEEQIKHKTARRLDKIKDRLAEGNKIAGDDEIQSFLKLNKDQIKEITFQLDERGAAAVRTALQKELKSEETSLDKLLLQFLDMNDDNFAKRYETFYRDVVPHLVLYSVPIGETLTLKGFTQAGYPTSANVKLYGTFRFRSLDKSILAGAVNIVDIMTFRDLYGFLTADRKEELDKLQKASGVQEIKRDEAEAALFGGDEGEEVVEVGGEATPVAEAAPAAELTPTAAPAEVSAVALAGAATGEGGGFDEFSRVDMKTSARSYGQALVDRTYSQAEIDNGVVRNAAIILKKGVDPQLALPKVQKAADDAKLDLKVVDWGAASGFIGQFLLVIYAVLAASLMIIFIVAIVILNNSTVMATMERIREIGTLRAIGAQKGFILRMFMVEAVVLGMVFGGLGVLLGSGVVAWVNAVGIPAKKDVLVLLFGGLRLHPILQAHHVVISLIVVLLVTMFSTLYASLLAMRVTPLQAMQDAE